jgi:signal transduction histidine kinase
MTLRSRLLAGLAILVLVSVVSSGLLALALMPGEAPMAHTQARMLLILLAAFDTAVAVLFGAWFMRRVTDPSLALAKAAKRVAAGDLEGPPVDAGAPGTEVAMLADAFNQMTSSLRNRRDQVVAQEKMATVGRLAAGVAHEVGNPLAAVLGFVEILIPDEKDAERRDMLERIRKETGRIRDIISDLLDYSRPRTDVPEAVVLAEVVDVALGLVRPQARFRDVAVTTELPEGLPAVSAAAPRLVQVMLNLLLNAADAMGGSGKIAISAKALDGDAGVALFVSDSGPGVPEGDRDKIFDPFFTTKEPGKGTGLGLAVSRSIAQGFGGDLLLSREGSGATFVLRLRPWRGTEAG